MSLRNLFFLDDEWRSLLAKMRDMEQNILDKHLLELAVERHLRKDIGEQTNLFTLQMPYIEEYKKQIKKALPSMTTAELNKLATTHVNAVDDLAKSLVERSFKIMNVFTDQLEKSILELAEERLRLSDEFIDAKVDEKLGQFSIKREKQIRNARAGGSPVIHYSDMLHYFSRKKGNNGYER